MAFANVLARREGDEALRQSHAEVVRLRDQLQAENVYLRAEVRDRLGAGNIIGESPAMLRTLEQVERVAATDSTVLLLGETGTGKELFASRIHDLSARHARAMVRVNCAAIPETLVESELFGREKGAFTGALARQVGRFELANHSTIFLDEIGELPMPVQVKLLRVLEERSIERLGSPTSIRIDTRIIAATHRNLEQLVADGRFREDLYYRLNVFPIHVPPLRERVDDIPLLVWRFVEQFSRAFGKPIETIPADNHGGTEAACVAGQHPRAAQRRRTGDDRGGQRRASRCRCRCRLARRHPVSAARCWKTWSGTTSGGRSRWPGGASAARAARPNSSG